MKALLLGTDVSRNSSEAEVSPAVYAIVLEWEQDINFHGDEKNIQDYAESVKENIRNPAYKPNFSLTRSENYSKKSDLLTHLIAGLAGGNAFDEENPITLEKLCDYVNRQVNKKNFLLFPVCEHAAKKVLRSHPKMQKKIMNDKIENFYRILKNPHVEYDIIRLVEIINQIDDEDHDAAEELRRDFDHKLEKTYRGLNEFMCKCRPSFMNKLSARIRIASEERQLLEELKSCIDKIETPPLEEYLNFRKANELISNPSVFPIFRQISFNLVRLQELELMNQDPDFDKLLQDVESEFIAEYSKKQKQT